MISVGSLNISRIDCHYTFCPWPSERQGFTIVNSNHPCTPRPYNGSSAVLVLLASSHENCTAEQAAAQNIAAGAKGVVVAAATSEDLLYPIGVGAGAGNAGLSEWATMVSFEDGNKLAKLLSTREISANFQTVSGPGQTIAIDTHGRLHEVGWEKYATLRLIGWEAQWLGYMEDITRRVSEPALVIPVFDQAETGTVSKNIVLPSEKQLGAFSMGKAQLDFSLECPSGNMDDSCSVWDRIVSVTAVCEGEPDSASSPSPIEIGRWINAFQRRGRWMTETPLLAGMQGMTCAFTFNVDLNDPWRASLSIRIPLSTSISGKPFCTLTSSLSRSASCLPPPRAFLVEPIVYPNPSISFDSPSYNLNKTFAFSPPKGTKKVEIAALITGHSGCEFVGTKHTFMVNGKRPGYSTSDPRYRARYMEAGSDLGCANLVRNGSVPNEHGTWYFGRNGWCDGMDVKPIIFEITDDVVFSQESKNNANVLSYSALAYPNGPQSNGTDKGCDGYIQQSSYLVYYK